MTAVVHDVSDVFDAFLGKSNSRGEPGIPSTSLTVEGGLPRVEPGTEGGEGGRKGAKVEEKGRRWEFKATFDHSKPRSALR